MPAARRFAELFRRPCGRALRHFSVSGGGGQVCFLGAHKSYILILGYMASNWMKSKAPDFGRAFPSSNQHTPQPLTMKGTPLSPPCVAEALNLFAVQQALLGDAIPLTGATKALLTAYEDWVFVFWTSSFWKQDV